MVPTFDSLSPGRASDVAIGHLRAVLERNQLAVAVGQGLQQHPQALRVGPALAVSSSGVPIAATMAASSIGTAIARAR